MSIATIATVPGVRPVVELGVGDTRLPVSAAVWDTARWDTAADVWSGVEPSWLNITCDVHDIEIDAGRDRSIDRWQVGTASITVDNTSGRYDVNTPARSPAELSVRPGRQIRVGMWVDSLTDGSGIILSEFHLLGRWFIDNATPEYDPVLQDVVTLECVDSKGQAGKVDVGKVADPGVGASETVTARVDRILNAADWSTHHRDIDPGSTLLLATTLGAKAVDLLDVAADSSGGAVFGDPRGMIVYRNRDWQTYDPVVPPEDTIGNLPVPVVEDDIMFHADDVVFSGDQLIWGSGISVSVGNAVCPSGWELSWDAADMATRVLAGRPSEPPHVFNDLDNQLLYGLETFTRTDLQCAVPADVDTIGARLLRVLSADWMPNAAAVTIDAATGSGARRLCATVDPTKPSRYRGYLEQGGRVVFDRHFLAVGVAHRIDPESWTVRIALDDAGPYALPGERWDEAGWSTATWSEPPVGVLTDA